MQQVPLLQTKLYIPPIRAVPSAPDVPSALRARLVSRPRLLERLNEGLRTRGVFSRALTLISAPAGYGKTTLAAEWASHFRLPNADFGSASSEEQPIENRVAWLSLDGGDNDLARFLTYVIAALQTLVPSGAEGVEPRPESAGRIGQGVLSALRSSQPPPIEILLTSLINEIAAFPDRIILVLDDYHLIEAPAVHEALTFLLEHLPPPPGGMHLVIATREDPPLPLARYRVRGQLTEIRVADLRFTPAEAAGFLNQVMGLDLSAQDVAALEARTEGWIAGLQMAALALQGVAAQDPAMQGAPSMPGRADTAGFIRAFTGSHRFVMDYLVDEILRQQPESVRSFLLQTSILDRLCGPLCDAVRVGVANAPSTAKADAARSVRAATARQQEGRRMLQALERGNLFVVPLDGERQWYRYHHLFADVLQAHLVDELPHQVPGLHRRASEWYEQNGSPADAIRHAFAGEDFERAAGLIELAWPAMDESYQTATWLGWAKALPEEMVRARPALSVGYAWALLSGGEMEAHEAYLRDAERWLEPATGGPRPEPVEGPSRGMVVVDEGQFRSLPASIAVARAYRALALGDVPGTVTHARRALDLSPEGDHRWRGSAASLLGLAQHASGDLEAADRSLADCMVSMRNAGKIADAIGITFTLVEIRMVLGRLREAVSAYQQSLQLAASQDEPMPLGTSDLYRGISELHLERGDLESAAQDLLTGTKLGEQAASTAWQHRLCVTRARLKEAQGDLDGALDLLDEAERRYVRTPLPDVRPIAALRTRLWVRQGRLAEAQAWARERGLSVDDDLGYMLEFEHITLARVLIARYRSDRADGALHEATGLLARLLTAAEVGGRMGRAIEILVLQALAHQARGEIPAALQSLERALALAEPEGYVRIFVDEGPPMAALLRETAKQGVVPNYVRQLRAAIGEGKRPVAQPLIEPLSERELEVLGLLGTELSGPEIARELVVSLNTMRTHTKNIYGKLGVNNRRAAVRRAEELGLL